MNTIITKDFGIANALNFEKMISLPLANVYVAIGRPLGWSNVSNASVFDDSFVPDAYDTVEYKNQFSRDGMIMLKISSNDVQPVAPRVDWANGTVYVAYDQTLNTFVKAAETQYSGNVQVYANTSQTVNSATINLAAVNPAITIGTLIRVGDGIDELKEVSFIAANGTYLTVNTPFTSTHTNANIFYVETSTTQYSNKFYVRNNVDQVFKCLYNNNGANSTIMPELTLGGQLPENPYIETADGYRWKYLYTIPSGLKNKFFTNLYMPVLREPIVFENARNGRIDIIQILDGGSGYFSGSSVNNYSIITVDGDGSGANVTADIVNGEIVNLNIIDGGNNYTTATFTVNDPLQTLIGTDANLRAVISPQNGHGFSPARELGASDQMISVDFEGDIDGNLPTASDTTDKFRQVAIIKDPKFANGVFATGSVYPMYTTLIVSNPAVDFDHNGLVYVGSSLATAKFTARVIHFDNDSNEIIVNRITGNVDNIAAETIYQSGTPGAAARIFSVDKPDINIFTGEVLYIENKAPITRSLDQTESIKLVVEF